MRATIAVLVLLVGAGAWAAGEFTKEELAAAFYSDLGPAEVDVSAYPAGPQKGYAVFKKTCAQCHTLARALYAPLITREDWKRYIARMAQRTAGRPGKTIATKDRKPILEFLAYDSKLRKIDGKAAFDAQTETLKARFAEVQAEAKRRRIEKDESNVKTPAPYTGNK